MMLYEDIITSYKCVAFEMLLVSKVLYSGRNILLQGVLLEENNQLQITREHSNPALMICA